MSDFKSEQDKSKELLSFLAHRPHTFLKLFFPDRFIRVVSRKTGVVPQFAESTTACICVDSANEADPLQAYAAFYFYQTGRIDCLIESDDGQAPSFSVRFTCPTSEAEYTLPVTSIVKILREIEAWLSLEETPPPILLFEGLVKLGYGDYLRAGDKMRAVLDEKRRNEDALNNANSLSADQKRKLIEAWSKELGLEEPRAARRLNLPSK